MKPKEPTTEIARLLLASRLQRESRSAQARRIGLSEGLLRQIEAGHLPRDRHKIEAFAKGVRRTPKFISKLIRDEQIRRLQQKGSAA